MSIQQKVQLVSNNRLWSEVRRYKVNAVVSYNGENYQNINGKNSIPSDLIDWIKIGGDLGDFILRGGTEPGKPVTGNIEFESDNGLGLTATFNDAIYGLALGISSRIYYQDDVNNKKVGLQAFENEIVVDSDGTDSKGIIGTRIFDIQNDDNAYIQKGHLDAITGDFIPSSEKGQALGVVPLNSSTKIDALYLPSYVDDVLEFANLASFPVTGETGKIYVALNTNKTYRWSGSTYVEVSPSDVNSVAGKTGAVNLVIADISTLQSVLDAKFNQGGNAFGSTVLIGSTDNNDVSVVRNGTAYMTFQTGDAYMFRGNGILHNAGITYSALKFGANNGSTPLSVTRNRADAVTVFAVDNINATSTGNLIDLKKEGKTVAGTRVDGRTFGTNGTASNDFITLSQLNAKIVSGSFSGVGTATTVFTVTIGSTQANNTYKVNATPTNVLSAALFYITNKTTTTFDVVYLAGLKGSVAFDWQLTP